MDEVRNEIEELSEIPFEEKVEHCGIKVWEVEGYGTVFERRRSENRLERQIIFPLQSCL